MKRDSFEALEVIERPTSAELVQEAVTKEIVRGTIRPGDRLIESELGNRLGVSRGPVREALAQLERIGLIDKIPYKGCFVSHLTEEDVHELYTMRTRLEGLAARRIAASESKDAVAQLDAVLDRMRESAEAQDFAALVELDLEFHGLLCKLSEHKLLTQIWENHVGVSLKRFLFLKQTRLYADPFEAVLLHQPIVDAISSGDPEAAEAAAMYHVVEAGERTFA